MYILISENIEVLNVWKRCRYTSVFFISYQYTFSTIHKMTNIAVVLH